MKCPKCRYVSHDYLDSCRKCSMELVEFKRKFNLMVLRPGDLDLGLLVDMGREDVLDRDRFHLTAATSNTPPGKSYIGLDELTEETAIDIQFDSDTPNTSTEPGELTKTFYVPEVLAKQVSEMHLPDRARLEEPPAVPEIDMPVDLDTLAPLVAKPANGSAAAPDEPVSLANPEAADMRLEHLDACVDEPPVIPEIDMPFDPDTPNTSTAPGGFTKLFYVGLNELSATPEVDMPFDLDMLTPLAAHKTEGSAAAPDEPVPLANPVSDASYVQHRPVDTADISVGQLDDCLNEFEDIHLDTSEIDHDINLLSLPATVEIEPAFDDDVARREREEIPPDISSTDISSTSVADETPEPMLFMAHEEPPESAVLLGNPADDEPGLQLEETGDVPSCAEERNADTKRAE